MERLMAMDTAKEAALLEQVLEDLSQQAKDPVAAHQGQHQQHGIGNDQQNAPHPLL